MIICAKCGKSPQLITIPKQGKRDSFLFWYHCKQCDTAVDMWCELKRKVISPIGIGIETRPDWCPLRPAPETENAHARTASSPRTEWISVEERLPETDEEGYSKYVLAAFQNYSGVDIAQYRVDQEGGAWYPGDMEESYTSIGIFVRAWMPLPEPPEKCEQTEIQP